MLRQLSIGRKDDIYVNIAYIPNILTAVAQNNTIIMWNIVSSNEINEIKSFSDKTTNICSNAYRCKSTTDKRCSLSLSADGKFVLTGSRNGCWIFDTEYMRMIRQIHEHDEGAVRAVSFSSDSKYFATGGYDLYCKVWATENYKQISVFDNHLDGEQPLHIQSVAFSPDNLRLVSTSEGYCRISETLTGKEIFCFSGCMSGEFSPDGSYIVTTDRLKGKIFDSYSGEQVSVFENHNHSINWLTFSPSGKNIASGSYDKTCRIWEAESGRELEVFEFEDIVDKIIWCDPGLFCLLRNGRIQFIKME